MNYYKICIYIFENLGSGHDHLWSRICKCSQHNPPSKSIVRSWCRQPSKAHMVISFSLTCWSVLYSLVLPGEFHWKRLEVRNTILVWPREGDNTYVNSVCREIIKPIRRTVDVVLHDLPTKKMLLFMKMWYHLIIFYSLCWLRNSLTYLHRWHRIINWKDHISSSPSGSNNFSCLSTISIIPCEVALVI